MVALGFQLIVSNQESELFNTVLPFKVFKDKRGYPCFEKITDNLSDNIEDKLEKRMEDRKVPSLKKSVLNFLVARNEVAINNIPHLTRGEYSK